MFGISFFELLIIMTVALVFIGPDKLPEAARSFGRVMGFIKKNSDALRREFYNSVYTPSQDINIRIDNFARDLITLEKEDPQSLNCEERQRLEEAKAAKAAATEEKNKTPEEDKKNEQPN